MVGRAWGCPWEEGPGVGVSATMVLCKGSLSLLLIFLPLCRYINMDLGTFSLYFALNNLVWLSFFFFFQNVAALVTGSSFI